MIDHEKRFEIEKQFKKDFGFTIDHACDIHRQKKADSNEIFHLRCLLNGFDEGTNEPITLDDETKARVFDRLNELI